MLVANADDVLLDETMAKKQTSAKDSGSGKYVVSGPQRSRGKESYTIKPKGAKSGQSLTVSTSSSSVASLDVITKKHSRALKRLADK